VHPLLRHQLQVWRQGVISLHCIALEGRERGRGAGAIIITIIIVTLCVWNQVCNAQPLSLQRLHLRLQENDACRGGAMVGRW
jgi:hypothetical protein